MGNLIGIYMRQTEEGFDCRNRDNMKNGLELLGEDVNILIQKDIKSWEKSSDLKQLSKEIQATREKPRFLDHLAEAMVARHFLKSGWDLKYEYPTHNSKHADFKVIKSGKTLFVHIKRLNVPGKIQKQVNIQSRIKKLEKIRRPYLISILIFCDWTDVQAQHFLKVSTTFIKGEVEIGESKNIYDDNGKLLGKCTIKNKNSQNHVLLVITWASFMDDRNQIHNTFKSAYEQFMPNQLNIILIGDLLADQIEDFESALFGTTYEDHTVTPITRGINEDGFWSTSKHLESQIIGWFKFDAKNDKINFNLKYRQKYMTPEFLLEVF